MTFSTQAIENIYRNFLRRKVSSGKRRKGIHVSDIVADCLRKPWYRLNSTQPKQPFDEASITNFYYGTTVHESFDGMFEIMEFPMTVSPFMNISEKDYVSNYSKDKFKESFNESPNLWVSGSLDAITDDHSTILDFKTCKKLPDKPSESYVRQINFYSYMWYLYSGEIIKQGAILYLEKSSGFIETRCFGFELDDLETNRLKMCMNMELIADGGTTPNRNKSKLCQYCNYKKECKPGAFYEQDPYRKK